MTPAQIRRIKEVFLRSQYVPEDAREAAVRAECSDDPEVLEAVLELVRAQQRMETTRRAAGERDAAARAESHGPAPPRGATALTDAGDAPAEGTVVLGRYELRTLIGAGAFGTVHRAFDRISKDIVAVKCVPLPSLGARDWHTREVASLRRARLPGVVELLATGEERGWAILVMSLVEGQPFPGAGVQIGDASAILPRAISLLEAVGHLHASGVYHRDLKPSNVLVSDAGRVTLVDFGIAQDETDASRWLPDEVIAGTLVYMAPDRLRGERATARSELFSIGIILIEALTGQLPAEVRKSGVGPRGLSRYGEAVRTALARAAPPSVVALLESLVAEDPRDRPVDTWAALDALRAALGPLHGIDLPRLGGDEPVRAVVDAASKGRSIDVVGLPGSGRTRVLTDAERALRDDGRLVHWVRPVVQGERFGDLGPLAVPDASPDDLDRDLCTSLRRRVADGLVVLVDDYDALEPSTRELVDSLRVHGAVVRVVREPRGEHVRIAPLRPEDLEPLVRGPERIFHVRSEIARILWHRTRGRPRDVLREVRSWCATGLAEWDGALAVDPKQLDRLRCVNAAPQVAAASSAQLPPSTRALWDALTLICEPMTTAAIADVLRLPQRVVSADAELLAAENLVEISADGARIELVRGSPHLADVPPESRREWSERAAAHLHPRSEARFRHLVVAGLHEGACRAALDVAAGHFDAGNVPAGLTVLDAALAIARRHVHTAAELYADLLAAIADAALMRATRSAVDLALYHANLAPVRSGRTVAWTAVLEAAAAVLDSDPRRALDLLDAAGDLPTDAHRRASHVVGCLAGRMTRSVDVQRSRVAAAAAWARRSGGTRDARALVSASTGWLRYEEGDYAAAYRLHARAARLTRRSRPRITSLCNAAMAALEACELGPAGALAEDALRAARRGGDTVNAARAELLIRQCAYRQSRTKDVDSELIKAAECLDRDGTRGTIRLTEAAVAWRARRLEVAGTLACCAAEDLRASGFQAGAVLAAALAAACGARADAELLALLTTRADRLEPVGIAAQAAALAVGALAADSVPTALNPRALAWAQGSQCPDMPREVLSPSETASRLAHVRTGTS